MNQLKSTGTEQKHCIHTPVDEPNPIKRIARFLFWKSQKDAACARCAAPIQAPAAYNSILLKLLYLLFSCAATMFCYGKMYRLPVSFLQLLAMLAVGVLAALFLFDRVTMALIFAFGTWRVAAESERDQNNRRFVSDRQKLEQMMYMGCQIAVGRMLALPQAFFIPIHILFAFLGIRAEKGAKLRGYLTAVAVLDALAVLALTFLGVLPAGISDCLSIVLVILIVLAR